MPRYARIDQPGLLQHVIVRGIERCTIFLDDQDRENFVGRLRLLLRETATDCYAWALLDNHFHLLLRPNRRPLAGFMRRLLTGYAVVFNHRHGRSGHLFQNRYKSIVCDSDAYLLELVRYIHLNPVRAGKVHDLAALARYPWCGHGELLGRSALPLTQVDAVLSLFAASRKVARQAYQTFIADRLQESSEIKLSCGGRRASTALDPSLDEDALFDDRILGGGDFVEQVLNAAGVGRQQPPITLAELVRHVAAAMEVVPQVLSVPGKQRDVARAKAIISYLAVRRLGLKGVDVAAALGYSPSAVTQAARRGGEMLADDGALARKVEEGINV